MSARSKKALTPLARAVGPSLNNPLSSHPWALPSPNESSRSLFINFSGYIVGHNRSRRGDGLNSIAVASAAIFLIVILMRHSKVIVGS